MLFAYSAATVPKITVILRKAYGGGYIAMCAKDLGADCTLAWPSAEIAAWDVSPFACTPEESTLMRVVVVRSRSRTNASINLLVSPGTRLLAALTNAT